ncbi:MAG: hypothetical protein NC311_11555 [Muribaculaceae bacterium]|nr:hypothetical protein [Muribaculaceae bacterium]
MNVKPKLQDLWNYLEVQADERLIVPVYNQEKGSDEFLVAESDGDGLSVSVKDSLDDTVLDKPFRIVQQIGEGGRHVIPSVEQIRQDERKDY